MAAALFGWGAWQRRWIADDGLIVLRTVRNLMAGNGPVFNEGERVESNTSTLWTYLNYLGGVDRRSGAARVRGAGAGAGAQRGRRRLPDARCRPAVRAEPAGPSGTATACRCAGLHRGAARARLRHLGTRKRFGAGLSRPAVVDDGVLVAGVARLPGETVPPALARRGSRRQRAPSKSRNTSGRLVLRRGAGLRRGTVGSGPTRTGPDRWPGADHDADRGAGLAAPDADRRWRADCFRSPTRSSGWGTTDCCSPERLWRRMRRATSGRRAGSTSPTSTSPTCCGCPRCCWRCWRW